LARGFTTRRAALVLYATCGLAAALSLLQDVAHDRLGGAIIVLFCAGAWVGVQHLGYAEFGVASRLVLRGSFRSMVSAQLAVQQFGRSLDEKFTVDEAWPVIAEGAKEFGLSGIRMRIGDRDYDSMPAGETAGQCQIRVPLPEGQYLNILYDAHIDVHPIILSSVPKLLNQYLLGRVATATQVLTKSIGA
jgi:UDP-GlcNAc:undecaprenyl-phosphate GlcNAc-1-phosphate transferase